MEDNERLYEFRICEIQTDSGKQTYIEYEDDTVTASMGITAFLEIITNENFTIL